MFQHHFPAQTSAFSHKQSQKWSCRSRHPNIGPRTAAWAFSRWTQSALYWKCAMQWLCEISHCFCTVRVYQVRMQKEECIQATLVWKCSHVHTENKQRQHCSWSLVHILKNESSSVLIFFSSFGLSVSLVNVILHFSCCVLLTAGVSSVQSRPFHCALCWEWWQSDDTALIKSWADF